MAKTILIVGYGPGISNAVAEKFGASGFSVALVGRTQDKLVAGAKALRAKGLDAAALVADAGDPVAIREAVGKARSTFGPIAVIHWNAYGGDQAGDLIATDAAGLHSVFDVAVVGLIAAVQEALPDLKATEGAVLVTNGAFADNTPQMNELAAQWKAMGLALGNATKHKLVGLLAQRLKTEGVYVGEVMVVGMIKGTRWDRGQATIEGATVAQRFWELYQARGDVGARVS
jgi:NAD(P)-dependent dehydrogenase (short-subunit alcohol dehydrogenase family)